MMEVVRVNFLYVDFIWLLLWRIWVELGIKGFFVGFFFWIIKVVFFCVIMISIYEFGKSFF